MERQEEQKRLFNFSHASRRVDVEVNKKLMQKYDEQSAKIVRLSRWQLALFLIMFSLAVKLYVGGLWLWGTLALLVALYALFKWYIYRNAGGKSAYTSGLLVPAVVVRTNPIELVALANMGCDEDTEQLACKRFSVKDLPLHVVAEGERVPCMALFGGEENGMWTNFEPRPLCWVTDNPEALKHNIDCIEPYEWDVLNEIAPNIYSDEDDVVLLDVDEQTNEVRIRTSRMEYGGISFDYPCSWKVEVEDLSTDSYQISCEKKGVDSEEIITITSERLEKNMAEKMEAVLTIMKEQEVYHNILPQPFEHTVEYGFDGVLCRFTTQFSSTTYYGKIYVFAAAGKSFTILMQDVEMAFEVKFKFFADSFSIEG